MTGSRRIFFCDVFAERPLVGNGLAVVADADDLSDETMLAFARETRLSETTYVQTATEDGADYRNRIWTPGEELAFAGHPSLGTAVAVARWRGVSEASLTQQTGAGPAPIEVSEQGERWRASIALGPTEFGDELDPAAAMAALGLDARRRAPRAGAADGVQRDLPRDRAARRCRGARPDRARLPRDRRADRPA